MAALIDQELKLSVNQNQSENENLPTKITDASRQYSTNLSASKDTKKATVKKKGIKSKSAG